jgi:hypothetical protein
MEYVEEADRISFDLAVEKGIVKSYREFKRRYMGFFAGWEHFRDYVTKMEMEPDATYEEVTEYMEAEYVTAEESGLVHTFTWTDDPIVGPEEEEILSELDR